MQNNIFELAAEPIVRYGNLLGVGQIANIKAYVLAMRLNLWYAFLDWKLWVVMRRLDQYFSPFSSRSVPHVLDALRAGVAAVDEVDVLSGANVLANAA